MYLRAILCVFLSGCVTASYTETHTTPAGTTQTTTFSISKASLGTLALADLEATTPEKATLRINGLQTDQQTPQILAAIMPILQATMAQQQAQDVGTAAGVATAEANAQPQQP